MYRLFDGTQHDPAVNLAQEEALLLQPSSAPVLFLWQNAHTVVIGRGQNAWKECRVSLLEQEEGRLVRRSTGGGAVYHDLGNLNFSFIMPKKLYEVPRQLRVIQRAVSRFGIATEASGRNDLVIQGSGEKFSGNAFRYTQDKALHHGTILMDVDMARLSRYLMPSQEKLRSKGVESVRARVMNLKQLAPALKLAALKDALFQAFEEEYGPSAMAALETAIDPEELETLVQKYNSWEWTFGRSPRGEISLSRRFAWGQVDLQLNLKQGRVDEAFCYSDANDPELASRLSAALQGLSFSPQSLADALRRENDELAEWMEGLDL